MRPCNHTSFTISKQNRALFSYSRRNSDSIYISVASELYILKISGNLDYVCITVVGTCSLNFAFIYFTHTLKHVYAHFLIDCIHYMVMPRHVGVRLIPECASSTLNHYRISYSTMTAMCVAVWTTSFHSFALFFHVSFVISTNYIV